MNTYNLHNNDETTLPPLSKLEITTLPREVIKWIQG